MAEDSVLCRLSDESIKRLLVMPKWRGLKPFFGHPKGMIALREHAASRGIYGSRSEEEAVAKAVFGHMETKGNGDAGSKPRAGTR